MNDSKLLEQLLQGERQVELAPDRLEHGWKRLSASAAPAAPGIPSIGGERTLTLAGAGLGATKWLALVLSGVSVAVVGGALYTTHKVRTPAPQMMDVRREPGADPARSRLEPTQPDAGIERLPAEQAEETGHLTDSASLGPEHNETSQRRKLGVLESSTAPSADRAFDVELQLLKSIKAALDAGNFRSALALINEHARAFPRGVFAVERESLRAIATCNSGDLTRGRQLATAFSRAYPGSPMLDRVAQACRSKDQK